MPPVPPTPDDTEQLTWFLAFDGPQHTVTAELAARTTSALKGVRLAWLVVWLAVALIALLTSPASVQPSYAWSVGVTVCMIVALLLRPAWGASVSTVTASLLIAALDSRLTTELLAPGSSVAADEEIMSPLAFMPVVHTALLTPSWIPMVPILLAHAAYAGVLLSRYAEAGTAKAVTAAFCACFALGNVYLTERWGKQRVLTAWRLERARFLFAERAEATAGELKHFEVTVCYIGHELRNPLHGISGALEELIAGRVRQEDVLTELHAIRCGVTMMFAITSDLLDLEMLRMGAIVLSPVATPTSALLHQCAGQVAAASPVPVHVDVPPGVPDTIHVDSARLRQIIVNGLTNAIKYAGTGASGICIAARASRHAATITFSVTDDGVGLPAGVSEEALFTDFNGAGLAKMAGSSGLGLPICCRLARALGGTLHVGPRADGLRGTCFQLTLPLHLPTSPPPPQQQQQQQLPPSVSDESSTGTAREQPLRLHLLIVDDSEPNRRVNARHARVLGCTATLACDGDEVLAAVAAEAFDVVLMDVHMLRVNGDVACAALRAAGYTMPVIAVTGNATSEDTLAYRRAGFTATLGKPFGVSGLRVCLECCVVVAMDPGC